MQKENQSGYHDEDQDPTKYSQEKKIFDKCSIIDNKSFLDNKTTNDTLNLNEHLKYPESQTDYNTLTKNQKKNLRKKQKKFNNRVGEENTGIKENCYVQRSNQD